MASPKKIPTKLKVLRGTLQKCRIIKHELETPALDIIPIAPEYFNEYAKKEWIIVCEHLHNIGLLATTDIALLRRYCYAVGMCEEAERMLSQQPKVGTQKNKAGEVYQFTNKWVGIWNYYCRLMIGLAGEFGFSPSARTRISMPKQVKNDRDSEMFGT